MVGVGLAVAHEDQHRATLPCAGRCPEGDAHVRVPAPIVPAVLRRSSSRSWFPGSGRSPSPAVPARRGAHRAAATARPTRCSSSHGFDGSAAGWRAMVAASCAPTATATPRSTPSTTTATRRTSTSRTRSPEAAALRARTGASTIDVVSHSMGAISSRYYIERLGGAAHVDAWVSLAGRQRGHGVGLRLLRARTVPRDGADVVGACRASTTTSDPRPHALRRRGGHRATTRSCPASTPNSPVRTTSRPLPRSLGDEDRSRRCSAQVERFLRPAVVRT